MVSLPRKRRTVVSKCVALVFVLVFGSICLINLSTAPTAAARTSVSSSQAAIYSRHCAACHGADGRARTAKGKRAGATDFTSNDWNTDEARGIRIITNGKSEMPSFKRKLTAGEIRSVFEYVLRFRR